MNVWGCQCVGDLGPISSFGITSLPRVYDRFDSRATPSRWRGGDRWLPSFSLALGLVLLCLWTAPAYGQEIRVGVSGGWAPPTNNVTQEIRLTLPTGQEGILTQRVDLQPGPHASASAGFVRSIGENFALGARLRAHATRLRSTVNCRFDSDCGNPNGTLQAATIEGRIIVTAPDWIRPYLLVGLGVIHTSVDGVTLRDHGITTLPDPINFPDVSVTDAGGDVGLGATLPVYGGLYLDAEVRVTGGLPGGKENAVTAIPLTLGVSYGF